MRLELRENLVVVKGVVELTVGSEKPQTLAEGDAVLFEADVPQRVHTETSLRARPCSISS